MSKLNIVVGLSLLGVTLFLSAQTVAVVLRPPKKTPVFGYRIFNVYPHDHNAFTQGLIYDDGVLYESTGLYGKSSLRKVELKSGKILQTTPVKEQYFAEGLTLFGTQLIQLTWKQKSGFLYNKDNLKFVDDFSYPATIREGWGLTHDGNKLMVSDGSANIHFLHPKTFKATGKIEVKDNGKRVDNLNELEYINGEIYANIWQTDRIARISPKTGQVLSYIDLSGLRSEMPRDHSAADLNGIAYDPVRKRLFVTGKLWPKLFEIELVKR